MREIVRDTQNRILSVARYTRRCTRPAATRGSTWATYLSRLGEELTEAYLGQGAQVEYDLARCIVSQQRAIHFGLMVNELVSNSFKHAFPSELGPAGASAADAARGLDAVCVGVEDNGVGLPAGFSIESAETLGVQVVAMLVEQMNGKMTTVSSAGEGTQVEVEIPKSELLNGSGRSDRPA